jgi:hypothetical protein
VLAGAGFRLAQEVAILEGGEADQDVTLPTWRGNGLRRLEGAAASEERQSTELALAVRAD